MSFKPLKILGTVAKGALSVFAPTLASALPGPLGGIAKQAVTSVLGLPGESTEDEIEQALATADPALLAQMRKADNDFKLQMKQFGVDLAKIDAEDRASARSREVQLKDWMPKVLAFTTVLGWFGFTLALFRWALPTASHDLLLASFGILSTAVVGIFNYYFGSSAGSARKTEMMGGK